MISARLPGGTPGSKGSQPGIQALLFDLDGTLLDSLEDIANAANRMLARRGFPTHELSAYRHFIGDGLRTLVTRVLPADRQDQQTIDACLALVREDYGTTFNVATRPCPGIPELLDAIGARGIKLAVLSNKPDDLTRRCVFGLLPRWHFDVVMGQREGIPGKPDPTSSLEISRSLDIPPSSFLFAGDSSIDMQTATAAGMFPVGVLWGFGTRDDLARGGALAIVRHPLEVMGLLAGSVMAAE